MKRNMEKYRGDLLSFVGIIEGFPRGIEAGVIERINLL